MHPPDDHDTISLDAAQLDRAHGGMKYGPDDRESGNVIDLRPGHATAEDRRRAAEPVPPLTPDPGAYRRVFGRDFPSDAELRRNLDAQREQYRREFGR